MRLTRLMMVAGAVAGRYGCGSALRMRALPPSSSASRKILQAEGRIRLRGNQEEYVRLLQSEAYPLVVATGSAGTGKTMLACREAVRALRERRIERVVITRPTVGAEEGLGFLPGSLEEKMHPWILPILDNLGEFGSPKEIRQWMREGIIEIAPLCFMRGRTFRDSFIIGDECQNLRPVLMKMLLTRLGIGSKMVVVGDMEQTDLPADQRSGLYDFVARAEASPRPGIGLIHLDRECVVRHPILPAILDLYGE